MILPNDIDPECINICLAINAFRGVHTKASCCGHGEVPFWISLKFDDDPALQNFVNHLNYEKLTGNGDYIYGGKWHLEYSMIGFSLVGPIGSEAYFDAERFAEKILPSYALGLVQK